MNLLKRSLFFVLKRIGWSSAKKKVWDAEFSDGAWTYLDPTPGQVVDEVYDYLKKYTNGGNILELGCGSGKTGLEMDVKDYEHYRGIDISEVSIMKAKELLAGHNDRHGKNSFVVEDICAYVPETQYNVILFRESLQYLNRFAIRKALNNCRKYLKENGVIIARICDRQRYQRIIRYILRAFIVLDKYESISTQMIIIVFR
jgi:SAM-dependent methyltransferase